MQHKEKSNGITVAFSADGEVALFNTDTQWDDLINAIAGVVIGAAQAGCDRLYLTAARDKQG